MESIVLESLVSTIVENLISLAHEEVRLFVCVASDVEKLKETFQKIQDVLVDAQHKQVEYQTVKRWLSDVRDVAYDVDDILDEWNTEILISKMNIQVCKFISPCFCFNQIVFRCKMGHKIKGVKERVDKIFKDMSPFKFVRNVDNVVASGQVMEERITTSLVYEAEVFGREDDKEKIVDLLLHESSPQEENLFIISVVGMGGLGKTTLAQLAYNTGKEHFDVTTGKKHFDVTMWVCVSDDFSLLRLTKAMIESIPKEESITKEPANFNELDPGQVRLQKELYGKRFVLVLDDVWNEDSEKWDRLRVPLMVGAKGSRILITTRKKVVADVMGTNHIHNLQGLSKENGWVLFRHRAFFGRSEKEMPELEEIGKEIVKECNGLPLAIKTIGSVMHSKKTRQDWEEIRKSDIWRLEKVEKGILPALMLSYQDLPPHLRQCFAYCSIFPKDYEISKIKLIYMWMAQGYLFAKNGKEMEELGDSYFDELLGRSLFQEPKINEFDGSIESCKMHDMVSDLAQSITGKECSIIEFDKVIEDPEIKARHSSFVATSHGESIPNSFRKPNHLRTIKCIGKSKISVNIVQDLFNYSTRLRVLDLSGTSLEEVPDSIGNLKHLRYLDLSVTDIKELPESTSSLCNLISVLRLDGCGHLEKLPEGIGRITSLRALDFIAGDNKSGSKIGELKKLNLLRSLRIDGLERVRKGDDAKEAAMEEKKHLRTLTLEWETDAEEENDDEMGKQAAEDVLECLKPHTNLMKLTIDGYNGDRFPSWIGDQRFSNLTSVELKRCECEVLPPLGQLRSLKSLSLWGMGKVKSVGSDLYGSAAGGGVKELFPKLERLTFYWLWELEEWDLRVLEGGEIMPSLLRLMICWCPKLKSLPPQLPSTLKELEIWGCDLLEERCKEGGEDRHKIAHIPHIKILIIYKPIGDDIYS